MNNKLPIIQFINKDNDHVAETYKRGYEHYGRMPYICYLVNGIGKRAIIVRMEFSTLKYTPHQKEQLVLASAIEANKRGWKRVVADYHGTHLVIYNWDEYYNRDTPRKPFRKSRPTYLGYHGAVFEQELQFISKTF
jgi:hypothetical protein